MEISNLNEAHLHLLVNHFPIVGLFLATLILVVGILLKNKSIRLTALGLYDFNALTAIASYLTGEGAEEVLEHLKSVSHDLIHAHEEAAKIFLILSILTGVMALLTFLLEWRNANNKYLRLAYVVLILLIGSGMYAAAKTGNSGGQIRHPEIRSAFKSITHNCSFFNTQLIYEDIIS